MPSLQTTLQLLFALCQLLVILTSMQLWVWKHLPAFIWWRIFSLVICLLPRHPDSSTWLHSWWIGQQSVLLLWFSASILEAFFSIRSSITSKEYLYVRWALLGLILVFLPTLWISHPASLWFQIFVAGRQYAQAGLTAVLLMLAVYLWAATVEVPRILVFHVLILLLFSTGQLGVRILDPGTGIFPLAAHAKAGLDIAAYLNACVCCLLWAHAFTRYPFPLGWNGTLPYSHCHGRFVHTR
jgi:hypothetical protein